MFSPVIPRESSLNKNNAVSPTSSVVVARLSGALSSTTLVISLKSPTPFADNVRIGPAEMELTRIPSFPRSALSNEHLHQAKLLPHP